MNEKDFFYILSDKDCIDYFLIVSNCENLTIQEFYNYLNNQYKTPFLKDYDTLKQITANEFLQKHNEQLIQLIQYNELYMFHQKLFSDSEEMLTWYYYTRNDDIE